MNLFNVGITSLNDKQKECIEKYLYKRIPDENTFLKSSFKLLANNQGEQPQLRDKRFTKVKDTYIISMLQLAPMQISGKNFCPSAGCCKEICIGDSGTNGKKQMLARLKRSFYYTEQFNGFFERLVLEIQNTKNLAALKKLSLFVRLNGYSDIPWLEKTPDIYTLEEIHKNSTLEKADIGEQPKNIFKLFPDVYFYDYTKDYCYYIRHINAKDQHKNYHLVYSYDKICDRVNQNISKNWLENINDLAVIVSQDLKSELMKDRDNENDHIGHNKKICYIDGDLDDNRSLDYHVSKYKTIILLTFQGPKDKVQNFAFTEKMDFENCIITRL